MQINALCGSNHILERVFQVLSGSKDVSECGGISRLTSGLGSHPFPVGDFGWVTVGVLNASSKYLAYAILGRSREDVEGGFSRCRRD